jgi:hypothetical protein
VIDLDSFDAYAYFPVDAVGHCAAIALALNQLTGWPIYSLRRFDEAITESPRHAVVLSPLGYFDLGGLDAKRRFEAYLKARYDLDHEFIECDVVRRSAEQLTREYLHVTTDAGPDQEDVGRVNLDLAIPVAQALLDRYFPNFNSPTE